MNLTGLIQSLEMVYKGDPWFGNNLLDILDSIKDANPNSKFNKSNSLGQVLEHMTQWKRLVVEKVKGNIDFGIEINSIDDWNKGRNYSREEFSQLIKNYKAVSEELIQLLKSKDDAFLAERVHGRGYSFKTLVEGIVQHDIYHAGQLSLLRRG